MDTTTFLMIVGTLLTVTFCACCVYLTVHIRRKLEVLIEGKGEDIEKTLSLVKDFIGKMEVSSLATGEGYFSVSFGIRDRIQSEDGHVWDEETYRYLNDLPPN